MRWSDNLTTIQGARAPPSPSFDRCGCLTAVLAAFISSIRTSCHTDRYPISSCWLIDVTLEVFQQLNRSRLRQSLVLPYICDRHLDPVSGLQSSGIIFDGRYAIDRGIVQIDGPSISYPLSH